MSSNKPKKLTNASPNVKKVGKLQRQTLWNLWFKDIERREKYKQISTEFNIDEISHEMFTDTPTPACALFLSYCCKSFSNEKKSEDKCRDDQFHSLKEQIKTCKSKIEHFYFKKCEMQLLNNRGDVKYWAKRFVVELKRLYSFNVSMDLLKLYLRTLKNPGIENVDTVNDVIERQLKSNLGKLLRERKKINGTMSDSSANNDILTDSDRSSGYSSMDQSEEYTSLCQKIRAEWNRLTREVSLPWLVIYATNILNRTDINEA